MRFLVISLERFPPFRVDITVLFGKEFRQRGHTMSWLMQSEKYSPRSCCDHWTGGETWVSATDNRRHIWTRLGKRLADLVNDLRVFSILRKHSYDFILVRDKFLVTPFALLAAALHGIPCFFWLSFPFPESNINEARSKTARYPRLYFIKGSCLKFLLYKVIVPRVPYLFVQSEQMKDDMAAMGVSRRKMSVVPMGVDLDDIPYRPERKPVSADTGRKTILYLGTLKKMRHLDFLIRVLALVQKQLPSCQLLLVGSGESDEDERVLWDEAKRLGLENSLTMTGFLPMSEAWELVADADICVSPFYPSFALNSTSPTKLIEYMAMGRPVIANNEHPEQRKVIGKSGCGLCVPFVEEDFATALITLLNDPDLALNMGRKGRAYVECRRDYHVIANEVEEKMLALLTEQHS